MKLHGKKILLGVSGSIAAYKAAQLVRLLIKEGAEVKVVMTASALSFITPLTLATLSKNPVLTEFEKEEGRWNNHVELGLWADLIVVAPATANTLASMAHGSCSSLLSVVYLSARCPVWVAPAMDLDMYVHPATQRNLDQLKSDGVRVLDAVHGELASGLVGQGRMLEPEEILSEVEQFFSVIPIWKGKRVLITAGPTREPIDPVRYISNHSTGKMGYQIAARAFSMGASVSLVSGPVSIPAPEGVQVYPVVSAQDMFEKVEQLFDQHDIVIFAAAVADYTPSEVASEKIKKDDGTLQISLSKTKDIAGEMGKRKKSHQFIVGFALETNRELEHAQSKLQRKNFDLVVLNSLRDAGAGFGHDTNKITILRKDTKMFQFELKDKSLVADDILNCLLDYMNGIKK
ncbi:MAG: bifunctional phosphopantothenoylcysteine decarboxylase/phosphopantothenate--cysteine ligase CoaBC [Cytophagaceae bacterium]|jgi:phosphopantothenoylcysteine decarboxylase/phosphopantothenate--cysteine ligase|nr:bifunctional phosphopantothenoylcysteine decarboxylase/phosphopantothenate--cysteine ligase CoaBC [Cytophagaceae bacterium]